MHWQGFVKILSQFSIQGGQKFRFESRLNKCIVFIVDLND